jgi:hypothetical protein
MTHIITAASGSDRLVFSLTRGTTVVTTRNAMGSRHITTSSPRVHAPMQRYDGRRDRGRAFLQEVPKRVERVVRRDSRDIRHGARRQTASLCAPPASRTRHFLHILTDVERGVLLRLLGCRCSANMRGQPTHHPVSEFHPPCHQALHRCGKEHAAALAVSSCKYDRVLRTPGLIVHAFRSRQ